MKRLVMIDNHDSFTWNLYQYFRALGAEVLVYANDALTISMVRNMDPSHLVISPGPGDPDCSGISPEIVEHFCGKVPILGVCLGHQVIGRFFGARVVPSVRMMHGKISRIYHQRCGLFQGLPSPFAVVRYHSLIIDPASVPACLQVTAWSFHPEIGEEIMAVKHRSMEIEGVQFHPESVLSEHGHDLLSNFLGR